MTSPDRVITCRECGKPDDANYMSPIKERMLHDQLCFSCLFWIETIERGFGPTVAIAAGRYYVVNPYVKQAALGQVLGFGGTVFRFRFKDGREVRSNNVFTQNKIPTRFRKRLPDNAVLLGEDGRDLAKAPR
jgi:hypothetical protein